tara:strand:- start:107 stop:1450 length:1344 start_codon:yes stop_codon:yes gene_type:complete
LAKKDLELKGVFKNIVDAYCVTDLYGNVLEMNKATFELLGLDKKDSNLNLSEFIHKLDVSHALDAFNKLKENGFLEDFKVRINTNDNSIKQVHINASLIYNRDGKPIAVQGIARDITQENKLKDGIIESESRLKVLLGNLDRGVLLEDENRRIVLTNQKFCNLFSIPVAPDLLIGQDCSDSAEQSMHLFRNPEEFVSRIAAVVEHKEEILSEEIIMADGKILQRDYIPIFNSEVYKGHLWSYKDVTKEKHAQQNLVESENNLKTLVQNLDHGIYLENEKGIAILANKKLCEQFYMPLSPDLIPGQDFSNGAEDSKALFLEPEKFIDRYKEIIKNRKVVIDDELKMTGGKILERNYIPIFKNNQFKGHLWSFNDVTLEKKYSKNLEAEKQKYSSIIANMHLGLIETNTKNEIVFVNQSFMDMTGYSEDELMGMPAIEVLIPEDNQDVL